MLARRERRASPVRSSAARAAHQAVLLHPKSPVSIRVLAAMHEMEALRVLLESALIQVQMPQVAPRTLH
ncbi:MULTISPECIES: hypothetical protein [unclassified Pseudomonas]|uniref:hypothetical protein n=1 Tax=unclassified Pseudomonas TaxID=196821 RepID=UPI002098168A|nr:MULTISPECIES: hypothetical protein [unclassified Pseudomonas]MCO7521896.1 hypothetical protein [Pseudomonas sp. 1]MCO7542380.1 hypothetical protein [Pseudomonas sp. VA159-2]